MRRAVMPTSVTTRTTMRMAIEAPRRRLDVGRARFAGRPGLTVVLAVVLLLGPTATPATTLENASDATSVLPIERDPSGDGYRLAGGTLWLAGDATISGSVPEHGRAFAELDDVSLLVRFEPTPRLSFFSETRLEDTVILEQGRNLRAGSGDVSIE